MDYLDKLTPYESCLAHLDHPVLLSETMDEEKEKSVRDGTIPDPLHGTVNELSSLCEVLVDKEMERSRSWFPNFTAIGRRCVYYIRRKVFKDPFAYRSLN